MTVGHRIQEFFYLSAALLVLGALAACNSGGSSSSTPGAAPAAPSEITIVDQTVDSITLEWNTVAGAISYRVYLDNAEVGCERLAEGVAAGRYRCRVSGLAPSEDYKVEVSSVGPSDLEGNRSTQNVIARTRPGASSSIPAPSEIKIIDTTVDSITLEWNVVVPASDYRVYFDNEPVTCDRITENVAAGKYRCEVGGLRASTAYRVEVSSLDPDSKEGLRSTQELTAQTKPEEKEPDSPIEPPSGIKAVEQSSDSITLEWNTVAGAISYKVYLNNEETACAPLTEGVASGKYRCVARSLEPSTSYTVAVSSVDAQGKEGARSTLAEPIQTKSADAPDSDIAAPSAITVVERTADSVTLEWNKVTDAKSYNVYLDDEEKSCAPITAGVSEARYRCVVGALASSTVYAVAVSTIDAENKEGAKSTQDVSASTLSALLAAPGSISVVDSSVDSITLEWDLLEGAASYKVYFDDDEKSCAPITAGVEVGKYRCVVSGLTPSTVYAVAVSSVNVDGAEGAKSTQDISASTLGALLAAPGSISVVDSSVDSITLEWTSVAEADSYKVYVDGKETDCAALTEGVADDKYRCALNGLTPSTPYRIEVASVAPNGVVGPRSSPALSALTAWGALEDMRAHTALSAGAASYANRAVTAPDGAALGNEVLIVHSDEISLLELRMDGNLDGDFDDDDDLPVTDTAKFEFDGAKKEILIKSGLEAGLYRLNYTREKVTESRYIDIAPALYVDDIAGAGSGDASSWENAYNGASALQRLLNAAASAAESGSIPIIVKMKSGVYKSHASEPNAYLELKEKIRIYGGYSGAESKDAPAVGGSLDALKGSDEGAVTTFSGDLGGDDGPVRRDENGDLIVENRSENSTSIFYNRIADNGAGASSDSKVGASALLSGVKLIAAYGSAMRNENFSPVLSSFVFSGNVTPTGYGAAMSNVNSSSPLLIDGVFINNASTLSGGVGGAVYNDDSAPQFHSVTFSGNSASFRGGAVANVADSSPEFVDVVFQDNSSSADGGGAVYNEGARPRFHSVTFSGNSAKGLGGAIYARANGSMTLTDCSFNENSSDNDGGAIYLRAISMTLTDCSFRGNSSSHNGGAVAGDDSSVTLKRNEFSDNRADQSGGAMRFIKSSLTLTDSTLSSGSASVSGGALDSLGNSLTIERVTFADNRTTIEGGAVFVSESSADSSISFTGVTFRGNESGKGGAVSLRSNIARARFVESVFTGNTAPKDAGGAVESSESPMTFADVIFRGNSARVGGAIHNLGGELLSTNVVFTGNSAPYGAGVSVTSVGSALFTNTTFIDNEAAQTAPSASIDASSSATFINSILWFDPTGSDSVNVNTNRDGGVNHLNGDEGSLRVYNSIAMDNPEVEALEFGDFDNLIKDGDGSDLFVDIIDLDGPDDEWLTADDGLRARSDAVDAVNMGLYTRHAGAEIYVSEDNVIWTKLGETSPSALPDEAIDLTATDILGDARVDRPDIGAYESL